MALTLNQRRGGADPQTPPRQQKIMQKKIGKIISARIGHGGYQDAMLGVTFELGNDSFGVQDFWGCWQGKPSKYAEWTEEWQTTEFGNVFRRIGDLLLAAKVGNFSELIGKPVEIIFENNCLKSWRILTEAI